MDEKKQLESLLQASAILHASKTLPELLQKTMDLVTEVMESESGAIYILDPEKEELVSEISQEKQGLRIKVDEGLAGFAASMGVPVVVEDAKKDPRFKKGDATAPKSVLCVPMRVGEEMIGVLEVYNKKSENGYHQNDVKLFQGFGNICGAAIANARKFLSVQIENRKLKEEGGGPSVPIVGNAASVQKILATIKKVAKTDSIVLVTGESGTGKEMVAKTIHNLSDRKDRPFMPLNCGALPENLLESELFGHMRGAFTGADKERAGIFEGAGGGTVFLDEIGETTLSTQVKLLRVLQEGKIKRVGGNKEIPVDVRILSATNQNLAELIKEKKFREDLYYRLNVVALQIPPLRDRMEDLPMLVDFFVQKVNKKMKRSVAGFSPAALKLLYKHSWKGNIRELENAVESSIALCEGPQIEPEDLPGTFLAEGEDTQSLGNLVNLTFQEAKDTFENLYFSGLLKLTGGNSKQAAEKSGVSEKSILRRRQKFGLKS